MTLLLVTTLEDEAFDGTESADAPDGVGLSLREALGIANDNPDSLDTITFDVGLSGGTLTLTQGQLVITGDTILDGDLNDDATHDITIDAVDESRVLLADFQGTDGTSLEIDGLRITGGFAEEGAGILALGNDYDAPGGSDPQISILNSSIDGNVSDSDFGDGAIELHDTIIATIINSRISGNDAVGLLALGLDYFPSINIEASNIENNSRDGILVSGADELQLFQSHIHGNGHNGIYVFDAGFDILESRIDGNGATGIYAGGYAGLDLHDSIVANNQGGGVYAGPLKDHFITNSKIYGNTSYNGGGVSTGLASDVYISGTEIFDNYAQNRGGGIYVKSFDAVESYVFLSNSEIRGNSAQVGGGIFNGGYFADGIRVPARGANYLERVEDSGSRVLNNTATLYGGGIALGEGIDSFLDPHTDFGAVLIGTLLAGNTAGTFGGGISNVGGIADLTNVTITANEAASAGGIAFDPGDNGPTRFSPGSSTVLANTIIADNTATDPGGADDLDGSLILEGGNILSSTRFIGTTPVESGFEPSLIFARGRQPGELLADPVNPALDAGDDTLAPSIDIIGGPRPVDLLGIANNGANASDLGAFELPKLCFEPMPPFKTWEVSDGGNGHSYAVISITGGITWDDALEAARDFHHSAHLATISSQEEQAFVFALLNATSAWLGGEQDPDANEPEEGWGWITGEPFVFENWGASEPNEILPNEDAIELVNIRDGDWNDLNPQAVRPAYIVEIPDVCDTSAPSQLNVFAAGVEFQGDPKFDVLVDGEVIASGLTAGRTTGESSPAFLNDEVQRFEFDISADVPLAEVGIAFTNDLRAGPGQDRTLFVRAIEIDGHVFAPGTSVTSFDTNSPSAAVVQQAEDRGIVHANGSLEFDVTGEAPQLIVVQAAAQVFNGFPKFDVLVNGGTIAENVFNPLASFEPFTPGNLPDETDAFFFEIDPGIEIEEVAIDYSNDLNGAGGDRNLFIQSVAVGGELFLPGVDNFEFETQALNPDITTAAEERGVLFANGTLTLMLEEAEFV